MALKSDGTLWGSGSNSNSPLQVGTDKDWSAVSTGEGHAVAIKRDGTLWAWGANWYGQLGDGTTEHRTSPGQVGTDNDWSVVSAGADYTLALKKDGTLYGWGNNREGELGEGIKYRTIPGPVLFPSAPAFLTMAAGQGNTARLELEAIPGAVYRLETSTDLRVDAAAGTQHHHRWKTPGGGGGC
jgi:alpha-tubulin suppressor-like RCC1 family protein